MQYDSNLRKIFNNSYDDIILYDDFCIVETDKKYYIYSYNEENILNKAFDHYYYNFHFSKTCYDFYCEYKKSEPLLVLSIEPVTEEGKTDYENNKFYYFEYKG